MSPGLSVNGPRSLGSRQAETLASGSRWLRRFAPRQLVSCSASQRCPLLLLPRTGGAESLSGQIGVPATSAWLRKEGVRETAPQMASCPNEPFFLLCLSQSHVPRAEVLVAGCQMGTAFWGRPRLACWWLLAGYAGTCPRPAHRHTQDEQIRPSKGEVAHTGGAGLSAQKLRRTGRVEKGWSARTVSRTGVRAFSQRRLWHYVCSSRHGGEVCVLSSIFLRCGAHLSSRKPFPRPRGWILVAVDRSLWEGPEVAPVTNKDKGLLFRGVPWQGHREVCCRLGALRTDAIQRQRDGRGRL